MPTSAAASPTTNSPRWPWPGWRYSPQQPCARYQFLGEFLHAYADTFSHRDATNKGPNGPAEVAINLLQSKNVLIENNTIERTLQLVRQDADSSFESRGNVLR